MDRKTDGNCCLYIQLGEEEGRRGDRHAREHARMKVRIKERVRTSRSCASGCHFNILQFFLI